MMVPVHLRWAIRRDLNEMLDIEADSFECPWSEEDFLRCLRQRNCIGVVAEACEEPRYVNHERVWERVGGFMVYELHKTRLHLLNFAVARDLRREGIGRRMVEKLASKLNERRRTRIVLEVRETNVAAQVFFQKCGFKAVNTLRGFYLDTDEDAYVMQRRVQGVANAHNR